MVLAFSAERVAGSAARLPRRHGGDGGSDGLFDLRRQQLGVHDLQHVEHSERLRLEGSELGLPRDELRPLQHRQQVRKEEEHVVVQGGGGDEVARQRVDAVNLRLARGVADGGALLA
eukprot:2655918-Pleurochrysis_carterae.AAC.2